MAPSIEVDECNKSNTPHLAPLSPTAAAENVKDPESDSAEKGPAPSVDIKCSF